MMREEKKMDVFLGTKEKMAPGGSDFLWIEVFVKSFLGKNQRKEGGRGGEAQRPMAFRRLGTKKEKRFSQLLDSSNFKTRKKQKGGEEGGNRLTAVNLREGDHQHLAECKKQLVPLTYTFWEKKRKGGDDIPVLERRGEEGDKKI